MKPIEMGEQTEVMIPLRQANRWAFSFFSGYLLIFGGLFGAIWTFAKLLQAWKLFLGAIPELLVTVALGVVVHELLHAATWALFCRNGFRSIEFGVHWKELAPYVHCKAYLTKTKYALGVAMPGIVLGLAPAVFSIVTGNGWLHCFASFFLAGAAADFLSLYHLRKFAADSLILDHPEHLGFFVRCGADNRNSTVSRS